MCLFIDSESKWKGEMHFKCLSESMGSFDSRDHVKQFECEGEK